MAGLVPGDGDRGFRCERSPVARAQPQGEAGRLERQCFLDVRLVVARIGEREPPQDQGEGEPASVSANCRLMQARSPEPKGR
ncbi:hypothetical protein [Streptomyces sp. NPDC050759]|uniref:hypothetical protein n=1 Tax=Streptomyces sp. NPDC050759 TaxID=3365635 RepID=UPI0037998E2E